MLRQTWLDGLRGIAAVVVASSHIIMGEFDVPYRSFWSEPANSNRHWIQLFPFRLLFSPQAMVTLFLVISGYSISIAIVTSRCQGDGLLFYTKLTSAAFRRAMRLYIPVVVVTAISHLLWYFDMYSWYFPDDCKCPDIAPWTQPWQQARCAFAFVMDLLDITKDRSVRGLNDHLITLRWELRGSVVVYLAILITATVRTTVRFAIFGGWICYASWYGYSDLVAFMCGLCLAEIDARMIALGLQSSLPRITSEKAHTAISGVSHTSQRRFATASCHFKVLVLVVGLYLLCTPNIEQIPVDFSFQRLSYSPHWDGWLVRVANWQTFGAAAVIYALRGLETPKALLQAPMVQFLGKISFPLYLTHMIVIRVLRNPLLNVYCYLLMGKPYRGDMYVPELATYTYTAWILTSLSVGTVSILIAVVMCGIADQKAVQWARKMEEWCRTN